MSYTDGSLGKSAGALSRELQQLASDVPTLAGSSGSSTTLPNYLIYKTSGASTFQASGSGSLPAVAANADAGAVLQSCLDNLNSSTTPRGLIAFAPNTTFVWSSIPRLRRTYANAGSDDKAWLRIIGLGGSVIQLSNTAFCFLGLNRIADYDTWTKIEIDGIELDATGLVTANLPTGLSGMLFGTRDNCQRINLAQIYIHNCRGYGAPSDPAGAKIVGYIDLVTNQVNQGEGTTNTINDVLIEDCYFTGGNWGINVAGLCSAAGTNTNIQMTSCTLRSVKYVVTGHANDATPAAAGIQLGSKAIGRNWILDSCWVEGSNDVGYEIDNCDDLWMVDCVAKDSQCCFFFCNFTTPNDPQAQTFMLERCKAIRTTAMNQTLGQGFKMSSGGGVAIGAFVFRDCVWEDTQANTAGDGQSLFTTTGCDVRRIEVDGFKSITKAPTYSSASSTNYMPITLNVAQAGQKTDLILRNVEVYISGNQGSTGAINTFGLRLGGTYNSVVIEDFLFTNTVTSQTINSCTTFDIGMQGGTNVSLRGRIARLKIVSITADTGPWGIILRSTATLSGKLVLEENDFTAGPAGMSTHEIINQLSGASNLANLQILRNKWQGTTVPADVSFTPGATTVATQYTGGHAGKMAVTSGTVTSVSVGNASGSMNQVAAGTPCSFPIRSGQFIAITYSVVPTCKVVVDP